MFCKVIDLFLNFYCACYIFSPVSRTFACLALVWRVYYAISRYMFTVGLQYNFWQITASFSFGSCKQLVVSNMLLFWCSWFKEAQNSFQHLDFDGLCKTTHLMLQSWYQKTAQSLVNTLLSFL